MKFKNFYLLVLISTSTLFAQLKTPTKEDLAKDIVITYDIKYERELTDLERKSSNFLNEINVIFKNDKLVERTLYRNTSSTDHFRLYDYKQNKSYYCHQESKPKKAISYTLREPYNEAALQKGDTKTILGINCNKYVTIKKGKFYEIYATDLFPINYHKNYKIKGFVMQYPGYSSKLGHYTATAKKINYYTMPASLYSLESYKIETYAEYKANRKKTNDQKTFVEKSNIGKKSPEFKVNTLKGRTHASKKLLKNVVVLNFWFTTCPPCKSEIPKLNQLQEKYKSNKKVKFIAIALDNKERIQKFIAKNPLYYDLVEQGRWLAKEFGVTRYPTNIIIDKKGKIQFFETGYKHNINEIMSEKIEELLD
ncbi:thiol-disulfide isomerase/thioredoxin [Wenyingzhuangia heitensis]|uniref:Thiol-disulfide isomerase/thioredoxin n=1 Tax=Wenyingzhuangia heitensis TaxID=1487859 RepID=A0ABX0U4M0_9FLAO|nr:TlpA disulfide reductase family protein [Wenyingzhuangia heitensis]NIJ43813.1 thiol-disulfide isomerase/thioredoxin [Wenyingzhuangia heitensis]